MVPQVRVRLHCGRSNERENRCRPYGTRSDFLLYPGLTSWANLFRPSGAGKLQVLSYPFRPWSTFSGVLSGSGGTPENAAGHVAWQKTTPVPLRSAVTPRHRPGAKAPISSGLAAWLKPCPSTKPLVQVAVSGGGLRAVG